MALDPVEVFAKRVEQIAESSMQNGRLIIGAYREALREAIQEHREAQNAPMPKKKKESIHEF